MHTINDKEKLAEKLDAVDKEKIKEVLKTHQDWYDAHPEAEKEEYEEHLKDITATCDPIIAKHYKAKGAEQPGAEQDGHEDL